MQWYIQALKNSFNFSGRARRSEYWFFALFNFLVAVGLTIFDMMIGSFSDGSSFGLLSGLYTLFMIIPNLSLTFRRLHDIGRSAWWILFGMIPIIGAITLLVFMFLDSEPSENQYGPNPKALG